MADPAPTGVAYLEIPVSPFLSKYIQCFWTIRGAVPRGSLFPNRVLPDGCLDIVFNLGDPFLPDDSSTDGVAFDAHGIVSGPMTRPRLILLEGRIEIIGVRFKPGAARAFFPLPIETLADLPVPLEDLWKGHRSLKDRLSDLSDPWDRVSLLDQILLERLKQSRALDPAVIGAIETIREAKGQIQISRIENALGVSGRQLERKFKDHIGLTPKTLCRVLRFQEAIAQLYPQKNEPQWADFAFGAGFYDQAHFIREFKALSGVTPAGYLRERNLSDLYNTQP